METSSATISVLVPTQASISSSAAMSRLKLTLASLARQSLSPDRYEVVLIAHGDESELKSMISNWPIPKNFRIVTTPYSGYACAFNAGLRVACGTFSFIGLDHELASPGCLATHLERHKTAQNSLVMGKSLRLHHAVLYRDLTVGEIEPLARPWLSKQQGRRWILDAIDTLGLLNKPLTLEDVQHNFEKVLSMSGWGRMRRENYKFVATGAANQLSCGWLAMAFGNHSVRTDCLKQVDGLDTNLDKLGGGFEDFDLGIRLSRKRIALAACESISVSLDQVQVPSTSRRSLSAVAYLTQKHRTIDVALMGWRFLYGLKISEYARMLERAQAYWAPCDTEKEYDQKLRIEQNVPPQKHDSITNQEYE